MFKKERRRRSGEQSKSLPAENNLNPTININININSQLYTFNLLLYTKTLSI